MKNRVVKLELCEPQLVAIYLTGAPPCTLDPAGSRPWNEPLAEPMRHH